MSIDRIKGCLSLAKRACALVLIAALFTAASGQVAGVEGVYIPNPKLPTDSLVGSNYTPAYAVNQVQFWHDFRPEVVVLPVDVLPQSCLQKEGER